MQNTSIPKRDPKCIRSPGACNLMLSLLSSSPEGALHSDRKRSIQGTTITAQGTTITVNFTSRRSCAHCMCHIPLRYLCRSVGWQSTRSKAVDEHHALRRVSGTKKHLWCEHSSAVLALHLNITPQSQVMNCMALSPQMCVQQSH